jgi:hypothetical protein
MTQPTIIFFGADVPRQRESNPLPKIFIRTLPVLEISHEIAALLTEPCAGLYFDWGPDSGRYLQNIDRRPPSPDPSEFLEALGIAARPRPPAASDK